MHRLPDSIAAEGGTPRVRNAARRCGRAPARRRPTAAAAARGC